MNKNSGASTHRNEALTFKLSYSVCFVLPVVLFQRLTLCFAEGLLGVLIASYRALSKACSLFCPVRGLLSVLLDPWSALSEAYSLLAEGLFDVLFAFCSSLSEAFLPCFLPGFVGGLLSALCSSLIREGLLSMPLPALFCRRFLISALPCFPDFHLIIVVQTLPSSSRGAFLN